MTETGSRTFYHGTINQQRGGDVATIDDAVQMAHENTIKSSWENCSYDASKEHHLSLVRWRRRESGSVYAETFPDSTIDAAPAATTDHTWIKNGDCVLAAN